MWLSEVIGEMVPKNPTTLRAIQLPGESIDHVLVRASTLLPLFSSGDKKNPYRIRATLLYWIRGC